MLSIIIVNYRQKGFLAKCISSLCRHLPQNAFEVIVVNNSKEESLSEISAAHPGVRIIENENTGFSTANNIGAKYAKGEFLLFLNADTELLSDFTAGLYSGLTDLNFGAVGLKLQFPDGSFQNSFGLFPTILNEYKNRKTELAFKNNDLAFISAREKAHQKLTPVDWVTGAALVVKKNIFESIGGFDERFFMYYEDIDLCQRLKNAGYENFYFPYSEILHHKGENTRSEINNELRKIQQTSQRLYYKLHKHFIQNIGIKFYQLFK